MSVARATALARLVAKAARKPPHVVARRALQEASVEVERLLAPRRGSGFGERALLRSTGAASLDELWAQLAARPYVAAVGPVAPATADAFRPGETARVAAAADRALRRELDLLGSGPFALGTPGAWCRDPKSGVEWPRGYGPRLPYVNPADDSDVKLPWEISRLQWLIPAGQAFLLDGDERWAIGARDVLDDWIAGNPYPLTTNWAIAMEPALRVFTWTWLFHALHASAAWSDPAFRVRFLGALWLQADFVERHWERGDVNGNHFDADAAGLVVAGLFFGEGAAARRWARIGWEALVDELPRQVPADGVDFEASSAYHRLVGELFLLPALHRLRQGLDVPAGYRQRLRAMAGCSLALGRPDGTAPLWGDADDARVLPLGGGDIRDQRHLVAAVGLALGDRELIAAAEGGAARAEALWLFGPEAAALLGRGGPAADPGSRLFSDSGVCVMRNGRDHVLVDCGPVGLAGRGGHGHNDCLAVDATLDGEPLLVDPGSYVYTASPELRNRFRSTAVHNTPLVDGQEQARIPGDSLWRIEPDATPAVLEWAPGPDRDRLVAAHDGYLRLPSPVRVVRTVELDHAAHALVVADRFEGAGDHEVSVALQLAPGVTVEAVPGAAGRVALRTAFGRRFDLSWTNPAEWLQTVEEGWVSPSYGVRLPAACLRLRHRGALVPLAVRLEPAP